MKKKAVSFASFNRYANQIEDINEELAKLDLDFTFHGLHIQTRFINVLTDRYAWTFARHMHTSFEFHIIPKGTCQVTTEEKTFTIKSGELYVVPPGVFHSQVSIPEDTAVEYALNCHLAAEHGHSDAADIIRALESADVSAMRDKLNLAGLFEKILDEVVKKPLGYQANIKLLIYQLLLNATRALLKSKRSAVTPFAKRDIDKMRMVRIEKFIDDNIARNISLKDVAKKLYLSEKQINRIVQKIKGTTFHQFMLNVKMKHALTKLQNPTFKLTEIAESLGFSNSYHFSRTFKKWTGLSPDYYRKTKISG